MKVIGNTASEKSAHAATAFKDQLAGLDCVIPGQHTPVEIRDLCKNDGICAMSRNYGVPLLRYRVALTYCLTQSDCRGDHE